MESSEIVNVSKKKSGLPQQAGIYVRKKKIYIVKRFEKSELVFGVAPLGATFFICTVMCEKTSKRQVLKILPSRSNASRGALIRGIRYLNKCRAQFQMDPA